MWGNIQSRILKSFSETTTGTKCSSAQVTGASKLDYITPVLWELLWLPVPFHAKFKVLVFSIPVNPVWSGTRVRESRLHHKPAQPRRSVGDCFLWVHWGELSLGWCLRRRPFWLWCHCFGTHCPGRPTWFCLSAALEGLWRLLYW